METAVKKKKIRLNVLDWIIIAVFLAGAAFAVLRLTRDDMAGAFTETDKTSVVLTFSHDDLRSDFIPMIKEGDEVFDNGEKILFGKVSKIETFDSQVYTTNSLGEINLVKRPGSNMLRMTVEASATVDKQGRISIKGSGVYLNRSYDINIGSARITLRLVNIEQKAG